MPDQFAADDPVVLGVGAPADRGQAPRAEAGEQGGIGEDRVHAGCESGGVSGEAMICAAGVLAYEQHRRATRRCGEAALQCDADPELPVLAIGERREEASGRAYRFAAHAAGGRRWRTGCAPAGVAGCRRMAGCGRCLCRRTYRRRWRRPTVGAASRAAASRDRASGASQSSASRKRMACPLPPPPSREGRGRNAPSSSATTAIPRCRHAGVRLTHQPYARIGESCRRLRRSRPSIRHRRQPAASRDASAPAPTRSRR